MLTGIAQSTSNDIIVGERVVLARTRPDFASFLILAGTSNVPREFLAAYANLVRRLTVNQKITSHGVLSTNRAHKIWIQIARELLELDFQSQELARICVSYALNIATAKVYLEQYKPLQALEIESSEADGRTRKLLTLLVKQYPDLGDMVESMTNDPSLAEIKRAYTESQRCFEKLIAYKNEHGVLIEKLQASSVAYFVWHQRLLLEISSMSSLFGLLRRVFFHLPTMTQYNRLTSQIETYFSAGPKRGRIIHRGH